MWTRELDNAVDLSRHVLSVHKRSPLPPTKLVQDESMDVFFIQRQNQHPHTTTKWPSIVDGHDDSSRNIGFSKYQLIPQALPVIETPNNSDPVGHNTDMSYSSAVSTVNLSASIPFSSPRISITTLDPTDSLSPEFASSSSCTLDLSNTRTTGWWNDDMMQPSQTTYPTHRESNMRTTTQNMLVSMTGLGIDLFNFSDITEHPSQFGMPSYHPAMCPTPSDYVDASNMVSISICPLSHPPSPIPQSSFHCRRPSGQAQRSYIAQSRCKSSAVLLGPSHTPPSENVGFVNFTPGDSRKILAGVAPSGSSKTKVRREKEAVEKRKKPSQAAVKTFMKACVNVDRSRTSEREGWRD